MQLGCSAQALGCGCCGGCEGQVGVARRARGCRGVGVGAVRVREVQRTGVGVQGGGRGGCAG